MRRLGRKRVLVLIGILLLLIILPFTLHFMFTHRDIFKVRAQVSGNTESGTVISRKVPAFASSGTPASNANNDNYNNFWRSDGIPASLAYDLSHVPADHRRSVLAVWYNDANNYDHTIINNSTYNVPQDYTLDVNPAAGGGQPPLTGWITKVVVKANHYHSRQHVIDMAGNNWLRINVTASDGSDQNYDAYIKMDVYDAGYGTADNWIFFGDSITAGAMAHWTIGEVKSFAQLINAKRPEKFPVQESGGIGYLTSGDGAKFMATWLALFPGKYVGLSYGTNDANGCGDAKEFHDNYVTMIDAVLKAGKIPVIPYLPWGRTPNIQECGPTLNAQIDALYKAFPEIIKGPDLWTFFRDHQQFISEDNVHPTEEGFGAYRQLWADTMLMRVYN